MTAFARFIAGGAAFAAGLLIVGALATGNARAADPSRATTGAELALVCEAAEEDPKGVSASTCHSFLLGLIQSAAALHEAGGNIEVWRLGANGDEKACFRLPPKLEFAEFRRLVIAHYDVHPELAERTAFELSARALQKEYPCRR